MDFNLIEGDIFIKDSDGNSATVTTDGELNVKNKQELNQFYDMIISLHRIEKQLRMLNFHMNEITGLNIKEKDF